MTVATIQALNFETPGAIEYVPNQLTDRKLLLSIREAQSKCHSHNERIFVNLIFHNLTSEPLTLRDKFALAINRSFRGGNVSLLVSERNGNPLLTRRDYAIPDFFDGATPTYLEIPVNSDYQVTIRFVFPEEKVLSATKDQLKTVPTGSGKYFIRFLYLGYDDHAWTGMIASNQIEICIE